MTTQQKFLERMEGIAKRRQVEFVVDHDYANRGFAMFQHKGEFKPLVSFKFDFQPEYASFEGIPNPTSQSDKWIHVTPSQLDEFVQAVQVALTEVGITQRSQPY
jgi:hypothetical protein